MDQEKKNPFNMELPRGNTTHATMIAVVGGYLIYLAYGMVRNTLTGASSMSMTTTVIIAGIMALAGLAVIGYGISIWAAYIRSQRSAPSPTEEEQENEDER